MFFSKFIGPEIRSATGANGFHAPVRNKHPITAAFSILFEATIFALRTSKLMVIKSLFSHDPELGRR